MTSLLASKSIEKRRFAPGDVSVAKTTTAEARGNARYRYAALGTGAAVLAKAVSLATAVLTVPLTFHFLGPDRYGLWMTMTSLVVFLTSADLGLGSGLTMTVAALPGAAGRTAAARAVSCTFFLLSTLGR